MMEDAGEFLLDLFPGAAFALSLRKLSTPALLSVRVRRSSDDDEKDIGFVGPNLDSITLLDFCGGGDGLVVKWYDQSGNNRNATNLIKVEQQPIVISGVVQLCNGKPAVKGTVATTGYPTGFTGLSEKSSFSVACVTPAIPPSVVSRIVTSYSGAGPALDELALSYIETSNQLLFADGGVVVSIVAPSSQLLIFIRKTSLGSLGLGFNGGSLVTGAGNTNVNTNSYEIMEEGGGGGATGIEVPEYMQEEIMYPTDRESDRAAIEADMNGFYGAY
ncbi:MAG: hypothetical protein KAR40_13950 [Candidatus Sabulitectum sp.]|nr:hypothetical protein [Candidatus Sabulitectum sp.]